MDHLFCWIRLFSFAFISFHDMQKEDESLQLSFLLYVGAMTVLILLAFRACNTFQTIIGDGTGYQVGTGETEPERAPLLLPKDDDASSWGSSYDSISHDEEDLEEWLAVSSLEGNISKEGENNGNPRRLCVICCDAPRDCFFLPCGHCAACFTCGTRYVLHSFTLLKSIVVSYNYCPI